MKSISKKGKIFTGKFASTAIRIGLAKPFESEPEEEQPDETIEGTEEEAGEVGEGEQINSDLPKAKRKRGPNKKKK